MISYYFRGVKYIIPPNWAFSFEVNLYEYQNLARTLARVGTEIRELLKERRPKC